MSAQSKNQCKFLKMRYTTSLNLKPLLVSSSKNAASLAGLLFLLLLSISLIVQDYDVNILPKNVYGVSNSFFMLLYNKYTETREVIPERIHCQLE